MFGRVLEDEVQPAIAATANLMNVVLLPAAQKRGGVFDELGNRIGELADNAADGMKPVGEEMGKSWGEGFKDIAKNFGNLMADAIINGNWKNAFSAVGSQIGLFLGEKLGGMLSGTLGKVLGSILPGLGSLLGPLVGWIGDKLFKTEGKRVNDLRDAFIAGLSTPCSTPWPNPFCQRSKHCAERSADGAMKSSTTFPATV